MPSVFWIGLLLACGLIGLAIVVLVGRRSYRQARELVRELGHLVGDVDAVLAHLDPAEAGSGGADRRAPAGTGVDRFADPPAATRTGRPPPRA